MTWLLASVRDLAEAELAWAGGAELVDLKDPDRGALGAWPEGELRRAVAHLGERAVLSATTGDLPMEPAGLVTAARATAATGVAYVKVGFFAGGDHAACAEALAAVAADGARLVAVLMADQRPDLDLLPRLAAAGFAGAMLDTADKRAGGLRRHMGDTALARFVVTAQAQGLLCGLAGSLGLADIPPLAALGPDYLGFRGALCRGDRTGSLDPQALATVRKALHTAGRAAA